MFEALGAFVYRRRHLTLLLTGALLVLSLVFLVRGGRLTSGTIAGLESTRARTLVAEVVGRNPETIVVAVFRARPVGANDTGKQADPNGAPFREAMDAALAPLRTDPAVELVTTPDEAGPFLGPTMVNADARSAFALVMLKGDMKDALAAYPGVRKKLVSDRLTIECTGHVAYAHDLDTTLERDLLKAELISLPLSIVVLLLVFRTAVASILPVAVGGLAVACGVAVVLALSHVTDMAQYTINVCSLVGLGVAVDYSLFMVARYREELDAGHDYGAALARAVGRAGKVVAFSGGAVGTGLVGLMFFEGSYLRSMGIGGAVVVLFAVVFALTFLPALLAVLGPRIHAGKLPAFRAGVTAGFYHRLAAWVMRRPVRVLVPTLAALLFMGVPFLHLDLAAADVRVLGTDIEARRAYESLKRDFPDQVRTHFDVAVEFPAGTAFTRERVGALYDLSRRIAALPGVRDVQSVVDLGLPLSREQYQDILTQPTSELPFLLTPLAPAIETAKKLSSKDRLVLLRASTDAAPESAIARAIVRSIRSERSVGDGQLVVGGESANDLDSTHYMVSRMPRAIAFIVGVTLLVLFLLLGSVVLPIKAVLMNLVSIAGSFGALVFIFQDGHGFIREGRPIEPTLPVVLFCILFGLSMDYEVLMLTRIKESYDRSGDNTAAVADGLEKTAGLISSAAAIMVSVFGAFALASVSLIQAVGFGMALAVALDATLVRMLLVPATMRLFGHLNWWAPKPLLALRRALGFEGLEH